MRIGNRMSVILASILGAFCIYCGQGVVQQMEHDAGGPNDVDGAKAMIDGAAVHDSGSLFDSGFVGDAHAQSGGTCCTSPAYTFTKIAEGDVTTGVQVVSVNVAGYREVVLYTTQSNCMLYGFLPSASFPFANSALVVPGPSARLQVNGPLLDFSWWAQECAGFNPVHYVVSGVQ